jgi:hypothetical protein
MAFLYVRPDEAWSLSGTVTTTAGATDSDYTDDWIVDGRVGRPARSTTGTVTWSIAASSGEVGLVAVCNCNSDVNATIGGGVSGTVTAGALQPNGIRLNGFQTFTPANITTLTVGFSGAADDVVLGELIAGKYRTIRAPRFDSDWEIDDYRLNVDAEFGSINPHDRGLESRKITGFNFYTTADRDLILAWYRAQRAASKPSLIVPDSDVNDAWVVQLLTPKYQRAGADSWRVELTFVESPRSRW